jgi:hypothetical protein
MVMINIEQALGCYDEGVYIESKTLLPNEYRVIKKRSLVSHFKSIYVLIIPIAALLICLIWFEPAKPNGKEKGSKSENNKIEKKTNHWEKRRQNKGGFHGKLS